MRINTLLVFCLGLCLQWHVGAKAECEDAIRRIAACSAKEGSLERLDCYDQLAKSLGVNGPIKEPVTVEGAGEWKVETEVNPLDDSQTVTSYIAAEEDAASKWGTPVVLVVRCERGEADVYIRWGEFLSTENVNVTRRVGDEKAWEQRWLVSTDYQATFYPGHTEERFIADLLAADRFVAQVTPHGESPRTALFNLAGIDSAIQPVVEECGLVLLPSGSPGTKGGDVLALDSASVFEEDTSLPSANEVLTAAIIDAIVGSNAGAKRCFAEEAARSPISAGKIWMKFTVAPDGSVSKAHITTAEYAGTDFDSCVSGQVNRLQFAPFRGDDSKTVKYPFVIK